MLSFTTFSLSSDKILALVHHQCGGNVHLDQKLAGQISLTLPELLTETNSHSPVNHQTDKSRLAAVCTWMIDITHGQMVLLSLAHLESGSSISVRCARDQEEQMLRAGGTALLLGCDRNKAALTWTGLGHSSNTVQLSYYGETLLPNYPVTLIKLQRPTSLRLHPDHESLIQ